MEQYRNNSLTEIENKLREAIDAIRNAKSLDAEAQHAFDAEAYDDADALEKKYAEAVCRLVNGLAHVKGLVNDYLLGDEFYNIDLL